MCNDCYCIEMEKCSIRGYAPIGYCCELCEKKDPKIGCKNRFPIKLLKHLG